MCNYIDDIYRYWLHPPTNWIFKTNGDEADLGVNGLYCMEISKKEYEKAINEFDDARIALQKKRRASRAKAKYKKKG